MNQPAFPQQSDLYGCAFKTDETNPFVARAIALKPLLAKDAVERDKAGGTPADQLQLLKDHDLLTLLVPEVYGGKGQNWATVLRVVREIAQADASLAHLLGYHTGAQSTARIRGSAEQAAALYQASVQGNWFWANNDNSRAGSLNAVQHGDHWILNGSKPFTSGSHLADYLSLTWTDPATQQTVIATIPATRQGWRPLHDWDAFGQRQTGSGTCVYENVRVEASEVLQPGGDPRQPFRTVTPFIQQSVLLNVFLGSAQGALLAARDYTLHESRPSTHSGVARHIDDPWVKRVYGDLYTKTLAATAMADVALLAIDRAWERGSALTRAERDAAAIPLAAANAFVGNVALEVTSRILEVMGARATASHYGFDRYWRNVRTHTLHNPEEYKTRNVGHWFLTGAAPEPSGIQ